MVRCPKHGTLIRYRTGPKLVQNWSKTGPEVVHKVSGAIWIHLDRFPAQTEPWQPKTSHISFLGKPNLVNLGVCWEHVRQFARNRAYMDPNGEAKKMRAEK